MKRRNFIRNTAIAGAVLFSPPFILNSKSADDYELPLTDLHVHTTDNYTIEKMMEIAQRRKVKFGIVEHPAVWAIKDDADLKRYIDKLRKYPVYVGLQPMTPGWSKGFSPEIVKQLDYVLMIPRQFHWGTDSISGSMNSKLMSKIQRHL